MTLKPRDRFLGLLVESEGFAADVETPSGEIIDLSGEVENDGVGLYHADYLPTEVGLYQYEWIGTGTAQVAAVNSFLVNQGTF